MASHCGTVAATDFFTVEVTKELQEAGDAGFEAVGQTVFSSYKPENFAAVRTEGDSNAQFVGALGNRIGHVTKEADAGEGHQHR